MGRKIRIKDIAKEVGCSPATVSQALNNPKLVNRQTRLEILQCCESHGYIRKRFNRRSRKIIGVTGISHELILGEYYNQVTAAILTTAKEEGFNVIVEYFSDQDEILPHIFSKRLLDGVIVVGKISQDHVMLIKQQDIPLVLCGHPIPGMELNTVLGDGRSGIYAVTRHLLELGHRRISYISGGPLFDPVTSDRLDGFRYALTEAGIKLDEANIAIADFCSWQTAADAIKKLVNQQKKPTAIVCESDALAYTAYQALKELGLRVPKDISLTGFDNLPFPPYINSIKPNLTTVDVNLAELGKNAVKVLLDLIESPARVAYRHTMPVKLLVGETTASVRKF